MNSTPLEIFQEELKNAQPEEKKFSRADFYDAIAEDFHEYLTGNNDPQPAIQARQC